MPSRKRRIHNARRRQVDRTERVLPPPEAAQHKRAWPMQDLLALGAKDGGLDADDFEAALQIVETFKVLTLGLGIAGLTLEIEHIATEGHVAGGMSERDAERCAVWFTWAREMPHAVAWRFVAEIEDEKPISSVDELRTACRRWLKIKSDRTRTIDKAPRDMLTLPARSSLAEDLARTDRYIATGKYELPPPPPSRSAAPATLTRSAAFGSHRRAR